MKVRDSKSNNDRGNPRVEFSTLPDEDRRYPRVIPRGMKYIVHTIVTIQAQHFLTKFIVK
jgi:hypothetical protein